METRFSKHLGKGCEIEIEGEKYVLKPLGTECLPDFFKAMKSFSGMDKSGGGEDFMKNMSEESSKSIQTLLEATLEKSFPNEWKENCEEVKAFGMKYMVDILPKIFEINSAMASSDTKKVEKIRKRLSEK